MTGGHLVVAILMLFAIRVTQTEVIDQLYWLVKLCNTANQRADVRADTPRQRRLPQPQGQCK